MIKHVNPSLKQDLLIPEQEFEQRLGKAQKKMSEQGFDGLLMFSDGYRPGHNRYFANYIPSSLWRVSMLILPAKGEPTLVIDREFLLKHAKEISPIADVRAITSPWHSGPQFLELVNRVLKEKGLAKKQIGVVGLDIMPATFYESLRRGSPEVIFGDATALSEEIRRTKSDKEIELLMEAVRIAEIGLKTAVSVIRPGMTELEVAAETRKAMIKANEYYCAPFPYFYIQSGLESEVPQRVPFATEKVIEEGDIILMDVGVSYGGYCADLSRTCVAGRPSEQAQRLLRAAASVSEAACEAATPGSTPSEITKVALKTLLALGYEKENLFQAYQGHSIGIEVGESPLITEHDYTRLELGMVFCVEPGIGVKGLGGARVEDMVLVTTERPKYLSSMERCLL
ncbi:MAG: Xaa-Pro peptidase family protein [Deltaproteobacteria bacterium]|nr:Xaa-Pro peptidase family protein [Deltaproteobacteria bacterium]